MTARQVAWARRRKPVAVHEVTAPMLAPVQQAADASMLPQTVWPSVYYGGAFVGADCRVVSAAAGHLASRPPQAVPDSEPLLTVLPSYHHRYRIDRGRWSR